MVGTVRPAASHPRLARNTSSRPRSFHQVFGAILPPVFSARLRHFSREVSPVAESVHEFVGLAIAVESSRSSTVVRQEATSYQQKSAESSLSYEAVTRSDIHHIGIEHLGFWQSLVGSGRRIGGRHGRRKDHGILGERMVLVVGACGVVSIVRARLI